MRFTIRDLLWLTVVAAVAVGWLIDARRRENASAELAKELAVALRGLSAETMLAEMAKELEHGGRELRNPSAPAVNSPQK